MEERCSLAVIGASDLQNECRDLDAGVGLRNIRFFEFKIAPIRRTNHGSGRFDPVAFTRHLNTLRNVEWVVYAKRPFAKPEQVLAYLGRYTHCVAIANSRILTCEKGRVSFRWKDYRDGNKSKVMTLDANEFIRRFLLHVLPKGFRGIRHFGFLANACCAAKLAAIRIALEVPQPNPPAMEAVDYRERYAILTGQRLDLCPICGGHMAEIGLVRREPTQRRAPPHCDTS